MNRKAFFQTLLPLGLGLAFSKSALLAIDLPVKPLPHYIPPYLKPGDTIGITCPAGPIEKKDAERCLAALRRWGFKARLGQSVGDSWQRFGGTDKERAADFQHLLDDPKIKAILFGRGGYGVMRMMDRINWSCFEQNPKWLIGYSDITALHCHVQQNFGIATLHADMVNGFGETEDDSAISIQKALIGQPIHYRFAGNALNRPGFATGPVVGGNLSLLYAMQGSKSALKTDGKILLIEDVHEYKYTVDRMLMNLKRSGMLDNLKGLLVGGFTRSKEDLDLDFSLSMEELIYEKVAEFDYPVCFGFPSGHQKQNLAVKLALPYSITVNKQSCLFAEQNLFAASAPINMPVNDSLPSNYLPVADSLPLPQTPVVDSLPVNNFLVP